MGIGADLRRAREQRGWSLDELSTRTKISKARLAAIEADRLEELPGRFYQRAFLRSYAREVSLASERAVDAYLASLEEEQPPIVKPISERSPLLRSLKEFDWLLPHLRLAALVVLGSATVITLAHRNPPTPISTVENRSTPVAQDVRNEQPAVATAGEGVPRPAVAAEHANNDQSLEVQVQARGPCWLGATADGERVVYRILEKDELVTLHAHDELVLRIGDAGNFQFSINGIQGRSLGDPGADLTVHLTRSNFRNFLQPS